MIQSNLLENIVEFNALKIRKKRNTFENVNAPCEGRKLTLNVFKSGIFPIKSTQGRRLKIINS